MTMRGVIWIPWKYFLVFIAVQVSDGAPAQRAKGEQLQLRESSTSTGHANRSSATGQDLGSSSYSSGEIQRKSSELAQERGDLDQLFNGSSLGYITSYGATDQDGKSSGSSIGEIVSGVGSNSADSRKMRERSISGENGMDSSSTSDSSSNEEAWNQRHHLARVAQETEPSSPGKEGSQEQETVYQDISDDYNMRRVNEVAMGTTRLIHGLLGLTEEDAIYQRKELSQDEFYERLKSLRKKVFLLADKINKLKTSADNMKTSVDELQSHSQHLVSEYTLSRNGFEDTNQDNANSLKKFASQSLNYLSGTSSLALYENPSIGIDEYDKYVETYNTLSTWMVNRRNRKQQEEEEEMVYDSEPTQWRNDKRSFPELPVMDDISFSTEDELLTPLPTALEELTTLSTALKDELLNTLPTALRDELLTTLPTALEELTTLSTTLKDELLNTLPTALEDELLTTLPTALEELTTLSTALKDELITTLPTALRDELLTTLPTAGEGKLETTSPITPKATTQLITPKATMQPRTPKETAQPDTPKATTYPNTPRETTQPSTPRETTQPSTPRETTQPSTLKATTQPSIPKQTASKISQGAEKSSFSYQNNVVLLVGLSLTGLTLILAFIGLTILYRVSRIRRKLRERTNRRFPRSRYTHYNIASM
ncbi:uncharacterized protein LOC121859434 isoform X1 [Homarus americanus]|uniref:uncharacterized protein LOC121859434 isoform X1 n=1 Tax=Homarus americanus TaxID=6706 RepID=UPI001C473ECF|nr:uncharacterized protein LOC121859434 isoform X1 [Homarus americanus]